MLKRPGHSAGPFLANSIRRREENIPLLLRLICCLVLLHATTMGHAASQVAERRDEFLNVGASSSSWYQQDLVVLPATPGSEHPSPGRAGYSPGIEFAFAATEENRRRSRWLYPAVGAVMGGAVFTYLTYRACQGEECIFPVGPPLIGIGLGALLGWGLDAVARPGGSLPYRSPGR